MRLHDNHVSVVVLVSGYESRRRLASRVRHYSHEVLGIRVLYLEGGKDKTQ